MLQHKLEDIMSEAGLQLCDGNGKPEYLPLLDALLVARIELEKLLYIED